MADLPAVPLATVSASKLKMYRRCARRYYYAYGENLRDPDTPETTLGTYLHEVLDRYLRHLVATGQERDLPRLYALARELRANYALPADGSCSQAEADLLLNRCAARAIDPRAVYALEMPFRLPLLPDETIHLTGRIDRIDRLAQRGGPPALHIIDYKSGRHKIDETELAGDLQLQAYVVAVHHLFRQRYTQFRFSLLYLRDQTQVSCDTPYRLDDFTALANLAQTVRADREFALNPAPHCRYCAAFKRCQPPMDKVNTPAAGTPGARP